ncbi:MAG: S26 family signal peptidase [Fuerstiella sp.]|nr:S26 family signal peptidase [Fuerstiella sp.]
MNSGFGRQPESQWTRNLVELAVSFVIAVILLRGFILEGYLISTGSMAPGLLGFHKRIKCPTCDYSFAFGISFDESADAVEQPAAVVTAGYATCPNCGQSHINVAGVPVNHGDQLLVHKDVFDFRRPRRWENVVFRNPANPGEAYVKRIVGLPGETVQVINGDVFIEGVIARKNLETIRDIRIEVFDLAHLADADDWRMPWEIDGNWSAEDGRLVCNADAAPAASADRFDWLQLQNWRWSGGVHYREVALPSSEGLVDWQTCLAELQQRPISWLTKLEYDQTDEVLRLQGVMPYQMQQDLASWATSETFRKAVHRLGALSHMAPVTDRYGYNSSVPSPEHPVEDLALQAELKWSEPPTAISVRVPVQHEIARLELHPVTGEAALYAEGSSKPIQSGVFAVSTAAPDGVSMKIEASNFDHRVLFAVNGQLLFPELDFQVADNVERDSSPSDAKAAAKATSLALTQQHRWGLGIAAGSVQVESLKLYRDVYYTPGRRTNGVDSPFLVAHDGYFVHGDNSPVSSDSRNWEAACVPHKLLLGKPFVVHLPSRPGKLMLGGYELPIRIPDFDRMRYIH